MRWIFVALLICNGIYFLWQSSVGVEQSLRAEPAGTFMEAGAQLRVLDSQSSVVDLPAGVAASDLDEGAQTKSLSNICWLIGPFMESLSGRQVVSRLQALDIALQLKVIEFEGESDYWVHIPPQPSREAAIGLLRELQGKNIDGFLIAEGDLANGISLGLFTQKNRAEAVHSQRLEQGYDAHIRIVSRIYTQIWGVFDSGEYGKFSNELWEKIKEGNQGLERRKNFCDKIASVGNLD